MNTVLITGATSGIGEACSILFAKSGYNVVLNYAHHEEKAKHLEKKLIKDYNIDVLTIKADISDEEDVIKMVKLTIAKFHKIDVLVNNAGIALDDNLLYKTLIDFKKVIDVNLIGTFLVSKYVSKEMLKEKKGKIINVASTNGIDTYYPMSADYDAAKAGVISLTHNFSLELAPYITVNCVAPGWVDTPMNKDLEATFKKEETNKIFIKRFGTSVEIAEVILFLSTNDYINNEVVRVDGGLYHV
ncbi:MAG: SDR family NAD(P)-dependent oxidoreductase [Bacilli bacterium]